MLRSFCRILFSVTSSSKSGYTPNMHPAFLVDPFGVSYSDLTAPAHQCIDHHPPLSKLSYSLLNSLSTETKQFSMLSKAKEYFGYTMKVCPSSRSTGFCLFSFFLHQQFSVVLHLQVVCDSKSKHYKQILTNIKLNQAEKTGMCSLLECEIVHTLPQDITSEKELVL